MAPSPTDVLRASVTLVLVVVLVVVVALGAFGIVGLDAIGPASAVAASATRTPVTVAHFALALAVVGMVAVGVSGLSVWLSARDVTGDLSYVEEGIAAMAIDERQVAFIPLRSTDEVGELIQSFDALRLDFQEALARERELRRDAEDADTAKAELLSAVSHELRTPLNSVLGFADILLSEMDGPLTDAQREDLRIIHSAGRHLESLFNDVLDLSRAVSDQLELGRSAVDVTPLLEGIAAELRGQRKDKPVVVRVEVHGTVPTVSADPTRLRQIVTNLASNAMKFTDAGEVVLEVGVRGEYVTIDVRDSGIGIAPEDLECIFVEFGQVGGVRKRGGSGLGLAIAKRLTELHGGYLSVQSEIDAGSIFSVHLPLEGEATA